MWSNSVQELPLPTRRGETRRWGRARGGAMMASSRARVAVIGSGISAAVCASMLAGKGVAVTLFESGRGAGGRMAQRREVMEDGNELFFDHGAPFFTVGKEEVMGLVKSWEANGLVAEWTERLATLDRVASKFIDFEKEGSIKKYVGVPGMNSICKALCRQPGVDAKFGVTVSKLEWLSPGSLWLLTASDGQGLGDFDALVASDKNVFSPRFAGLTGRPPPLDMTTICPELAMSLQHIPVHSCFAVMLAFSEPLYSIPAKGLRFQNSDVLSWAFCDSSKPGRPSIPPHSECWVLHSTSTYAAGIIAKTGLQKLSANILTEIAEELFKEFERQVVNIPRPFFMKAHRWGSAFPAICIGGDEKCLFDKGKKLAICGDFCASATVEGAVLSGMCAASKMLEALSLSSP